jgi:phage gpG-like protein
MPISKSGKPIAQQLADYKRMHAQWPRHVGTEAVKFFKSSFDRQAFQADTSTKWPALKPSSIKARHKKKGRKMLMGTGRLKRSIRVIEATTTRVIVGTDVPYAQVHNDGFRGIQYIRPHKRSLTITSKVQGSYQGTSQRRRKTTLTMAGTRFNVRGHTRRMRMPQRQFIGQSNFFNKRLTMQRAYQTKQALGIR